MAGNDDSSPDKRQAISEAERKRLRLAETLRRNLAQRKQQARARRQGAADEVDGLPAAKTDESSPSGDVDRDEGLPR
ncbi:hypothetical protein [Rhizobium sp. SG2393]|uniref:hypothetical protein n=1 Tax=Rhizobium sp. SG2393 TaxID=3276279 RepID=UPI00366DD503